MQQIADSCFLTLLYQTVMHRFETFQTTSARKSLQNQEGGKFFPIGVKNMNLAKEIPAKLQAILIV